MSVWVVGVDSVSSFFGTEQTKLSKKNGQKVKKQEEGHLMHMIYYLETKLSSYEVPIISEIDAC